MVMIPQPSKAEIINDMLEDGDIVEWHRHYIGYSALGGNCMRAVWYAFRWAYMRSHTRRIGRLFNRGHDEESKIIHDLKRIGIRVIDEQKELVGSYGHVLGHIDSNLENVPGFDEVILGEFKTANDKRFSAMKKLGIKKSDPVYYGQAQSYMGKQDLRNCLFIAVNKNTDERYLEIIEFNKSDFNDLERRGISILLSDVPPNKIGEVTWFECKYCNAIDICQKDGKILKSCRTCSVGTIEEEGKWSCGGNNTLTLQEQRTACDKYELLESLR